MYAIINGKIISGNSILRDHALLIENNIIAKVIPQKNVPPTLEKLDVKGAYIAPGFIDLQINGCGGVLFNDDISINTLKIMLETNVKFGCTSFLPTLVSTSKKGIVKALEVTTKAYNKLPNNILGIHIEGPYISKLKKGIHNESYIRPLNEDEANIIRLASKKLPIKLTLAPEVNDLGLVSNLVKSGITVSLGHSNATYEQTMEVLDLGVFNATHLFNAMAPIHHRDPGIITAILSTQDVCVGMVMDGYHIDFNLIRLVKKIKQENLYIVTDAISAVGTTNIKKFKFGGHEVFIVDGKALDKNGILGGSMITMIDSVRNSAEILGFGLVEAVRMATIYPARVIGRHNDLGLIKHGYIANLAIFDANYKMRYTILNGEPIKIA